MLHVRPFTYVTSVLLLLPSVVIVTLRVLEARKERPKDKDGRTIFSMNGFAGTCISSSLSSRGTSTENIGGRRGSDAEGAS